MKFQRLILTLFLIFFIFNVFAADVNATWDVDANGNWSTAANWSTAPQIPDGTAAVANFTGTFSATRTVTVDSTFQVATINKGNTTSQDFVLTSGILRMYSAINNTAAATLTINSNLVLENDIGIETTSDIIILAGVVSGTGGITKTGTNELQFRGTAANTFTGSTNVNVGTMILASPGFASLGGDVVIGGGTLELATDGQFASASNLTISSGTFKLDDHSSTLESLTFNGGSITDNTVGLNLTGTSAALTMRNTTLPGVVNLTGASGGDVIFDSTNNGTAAISANLDLGSVIRTFNIANGTAAIDMNITGMISGTGGITKTSAGTLNFSGENDYTGTTTINGGLLSLTGSGTLGNSSPLTVTSGSFEITANAGTKTIGALNGGGSGINLNNNTLVISSGSFAGDISGTGGITKTTSGTLTFTAATSYTGTSTINAGTLTLSGSGTLGDSSPLAINGGSFTIATAAGAKTIGALSGGGSGIALNNNTLTIPNGSFAADISGTGGITKSTAGTLVLSAVTTYTGTSTINAGTLALSGAGTLGSGSPLTINAGSFIIASGGGTKTIGTLSGGGSGIALNNNTLIIPSGSFAADISGTGGITKTTAGTLTYTAETSYTGTTTINAGTLTLSGAGTLGNASPLTINGGSFVIAAGAGTKTIGALNGGGSGITLNDNTINIPSGSFSGAITGTGDLNKISANKLTLSGAITLTGGTATTQAGTLLLNGTLTASNVSVESGGTLGGIGTITADVAINSGGTTSPGASIGTLTIMGAYTQSSGSTFAAEIDSAGNSDLLRVLGGVATINAGASLEIDPAPGVYLPNSAYTIIESDTPIVGQFGTVFVTIPGFQAALTKESELIGIILTAGGFSNLSTLVTGNAQKVAQCLDGQPIISGTDLEIVAEALQPLTSTPSSLQNALDQMQPAIFGALNIIEESQAAFLQSSFSHRLEAWGNGRCSELEPNAWDLWVMPAFEFIKERSHEQNVGYSTDIYGVMAGTDRRLAGPFHLGIAAGYAHGSVHFKRSRGKVRSNSAYGGLYTFWQQESFHVLASVIGGWNHYHGFRHIKFTTLNRRSKHTNHGYILGGQFETAYAINRKNMRVQPFGRTEYIYSTQKSYHEHGAGVLDLKVNRKSSDRFRSDLGIDFSQCFKLSCGQIIPSAYVSWVYEKELRGGHMKATFIDLDCEMSVHAYRPVRSLFAPGAGLKGIFCGKRISIGLRWDGEFGKRYSNQKALAEANFGF